MGGWLKRGAAGSLNRILDEALAGSQYVPNPPYRRQYMHDRRR